ncbi:hypothetical protein [Solimicrobium silvestre]|uniref:Uncharacterized protein n=1 Tax=Solimicrobium silvestre TaxID=2099400 RepID=A0A2S9GXF5_9BURK|nr:hypothetical protein [Solimicrobium silvestre]PRC92388.1 hypothetical protein S2091_2763 [Solimicrobium silvestre]
MENQNPINKALEIVSLIFGIGILLVGVLVTGFGIAGLIEGMHGGILAACSMIIFGALIAFVGWLCSKFGFDECQ